MTPLERRYRRLLGAFPRGYREHRGEELVGTLLDAAPPGRRRPPVRDTLDLLRAAAVAWRRALTAPAVRASVRDGLALGAAGAAALSGAVEPVLALIVLGGLVGRLGLFAAVLAVLGAVARVGDTAAADGSAPAAVAYLALLAVVAVVGALLRRRCDPPGSYNRWALATLAALAGHLTGLGEPVLVAVLLGLAVAGLLRRPAYAVAAAVASVGVAAWAWATVWDRATYGYTTTVGNLDAAVAVGLVAVAWGLAIVALVRQSSRAYVGSTSPGLGSQSDSGVRANPSRW